MTVVARSWLFAAVLLAGSGAAGTADAASQAQLDRLNGFALLLGRAIGCELDTARAQDVIGAWLDETFPPGSAEQQRYLPRFVESLRFHAREQHLGHSPDSCSDIAHAFEDLYW
jgi:hypothetical protein